MKKLKIYNKKAFLLYLSIIAIIGLIWSCEEESMKVFWNDNEAAVLTGVSPEAEFESFDVTIYGKYFSSKADNTVTFNGIEATIVSANLTEIVATIPEGATTGDIIVTSDGHASVGLPFTVLQPIVATITNLSISSGKVRDEVIITGTEFSTIPEENIVLFNGTPAVVTASTTTTITTMVPAFCTSGNITVTRDLPSNGVMFTLIDSPTLVVPLSDDDDDAEEGALNGWVELGSSDLELAEYDTWDALDDGVAQGVQTIGVRFNNITIPAGATILAAAIQFECDATGSNPAQLTISAENIGNSPPFEEVAYSITARTKTSANAVWDIPPWINKQDRGPAQRTVDLRDIIIELIAHQDWTSGNSISFIMEASGPSIGVTSSSAGREAEADVGDDAAELTIIYEL